MKSDNESIFDASERRFLIEETDNNDDVEEDLGDVCRNNFWNILRIPFFFFFFGISDKCVNYSENKVFPAAFFAATNNKGCATNVCRRVKKGREVSGANKNGFRNKVESSMVDRGWEKGRQGAKVLGQFKAIISNLILAKRESRASKTKPMKPNLLKSNQLKSTVTFSNLL